MKKNSNWVENYRKYDEFEESDDDYGEQVGGVIEPPTNKLFAINLGTDSYRALNLFICSPLRLGLDGTHGNSFFTFWSQKVKGILSIANRSLPNIRSPGTETCSLKDLEDIIFQSQNTPEKIMLTYLKNVQLFTTIVKVYIKNYKQNIFEDLERNGILPRILKSYDDKYEEYKKTLKYIDFFYPGMVLGKQQTGNHWRLLCFFADRIEVYRRHSYNKRVGAGQKSQRRFTYLENIYSYSEVDINVNLNNPTELITTISFDDPRMAYDILPVSDSSDNSQAIYNNNCKYILRHYWSNKNILKPAAVPNWGDLQAEPLFKEIMDGDGEDTIESDGDKLYLFKDLYAQCSNYIMQCFILLYIRKYQVFNNTDFGMDTLKKRTTIKQLFNMYFVSGIQTEASGLTTKKYNGPYGDKVASFFSMGMAGTHNTSAFAILNNKVKVVLVDLKRDITNMNESKNVCLKKISNDVTLLTEFISEDSTSGTPLTGGYSDSETSVDSFVNRESDTSVDSFVNRESNTSVDSFVNRESDTSVDSFVNRESDNELVGGATPGSPPTYDVQTKIGEVKTTFTAIIQDIDEEQEISSLKYLSDITEGLKKAIEFVKAQIISVNPVNPEIQKSKPISQQFGDLIDSLNEIAGKLKIQNGGGQYQSGGSAIPGAIPEIIRLIDALLDENERLRTDIRNASSSGVSSGQHHATVADQHHDAHIQELRRALGFLEQIRDNSRNPDVILRLVNDALGHHNRTIMPGHHAIRRLHMDLANSHGNLEKELKEQKDETERYKRDKYDLINYGQQLGIQGTMLMHSLNNKVIQANNLRYHYKRQLKLNKFYKKIFKEKKIRLTKKQQSILDDFKEREAKDLRERAMNEDDNFDISPLSEDSDDDIDFSDSSFAETSSEYELVRT